jgi:hypothetical protein
VRGGKTWQQVKAMAARLGIPVGAPGSSVLLPPGLYLIDVTAEKTLWVSIPNEPADQLLSLNQATEELMKPALAALRAHKTR